jgi:biofilm protein TabA
MAIIGNLNKLKKQLLNKNLDAVFDYFIEALDKQSGIHKRILNLPVGSFDKVNITNEIFALEQVFYTQDRVDCFIESHRKYIDFQLILQGVEQMEYIDIGKLKIDRKYDEKKDLITYKFVSNTSRFLMEEGDLAIFFTDDGHMGLPQYKNPELVYKTVVKVPKGNFNL